MKAQPDVKLQVAVALVGGAQELPHAWQFMIVSRLVSQPFEAVPSQSSHRASQLMIWHVPEPQVSMAFGRLQLTLQPPQCVFVLSRCSHPSLSSPSQLS